MWLTWRFGTDIDVAGLESHWTYIDVDRSTGLQIEGCAIYICVCVTISFIYTYGYGYTFIPTNCSNYRVPIAAGFWDILRPNDLPSGR